MQWEIYGVFKLVRVIRLRRGLTSVTLWLSRWLRVLVLLKPLMKCQWAEWVGSCHLLLLLLLVLPNCWVYFSLDFGSVFDNGVVSPVTGLFGVKMGFILFNLVFVEFFFGL